MTTIHNHLTERLRDYPLYSQEGVENPLVLARLYCPYSPAKWYITEYDPEDRIAFGYSMGLFEAEWGYISIDEMEECLIGGELKAIFADSTFVPTRFFVAL